MRFLIFLLLSFFVFGCGDVGVYVEKHVISKKEMENRFGPDVDGHAIWTDLPEGTVCDIYMWPMNDYHDTPRYHEVLGHEIRHCFEGHWHEEPN